MPLANFSNNHAYNKALQPVAHDLRYSMTKAEACLWKFVLRAGGICGYTFRRQRPVLNYVADFMCKELMLIVEVDGITHHNAEAAARDRCRQAVLEAAGFTVLRFTDEDILRNINGVRIAIEGWIEGRKSMGG